MSEQHPNWCGHHGDVNCTCGLESRLTINSLKSKLAHKQEQCDQLAHENIELEDQFAEARAEVAALNDAKVTHYICGAADARQQARQEAAREIIALMGGWSLQNSTLITCRGIVARHFGLEE